MIRREEGKSFRERNSKEALAWGKKLIVPRRVGPCDVTSKSELEKLAKEIEFKEKHLNLLSGFFSRSNCTYYMASAKLLFSH